MCVCVCGISQVLGCRKFFDTVSFLSNRPFLHHLCVWEDEGFQVSTTPPPQALSVFILFICIFISILILIFPFFPSFFYYYYFIVLSWKGVWLVMGLQGSSFGEIFQ